MTTREWLRDGATVYTLKDNDKPRRRGMPEKVNDNWFTVYGPNAEAVATEIHAALTAGAAPEAAPEATPGDEPLPDDWELEQRVFNACGPETPDHLRDLLKDLWKAYCDMEVRAKATEAKA